MKRMLPVLLALGLLIVGLTGFFIKPSALPPDATHAAPSSVSDSALALSETSIYQLQAPWTNQDGDSVRLVDLRGRPHLVAMFFTHCGYACPRIVHDLKQILAALPEQDRSQVGVVLVSIDPERDTPDALRQFAEAHHLDPAQWTLLRSEDEYVREIAAVLGVRYKQESDGQFAHSNRIILLSAEGEILHHHDGLGADPSETARAASAAL